MAYTFLLFCVIPYEFALTTVKFINLKQKNMKPTIRIALADHSVEHLNHLKKILNQIAHFTLIFEALTMPDLIKKVSRHAVDVVLIHFQFPQFNAASFLAKMASTYPQLRVILTSLYHNPMLLWHSLNSGVNGLLTLQANKQQLQETVEGVAEQGYFCPEHILALVASFQNTPAQSQAIAFTTQELDIIKLICQEMTSSEMAKTLFLSVRTVDWHRTAIKQKIGAKSNVGIVKYAINHGLAD